MALLACHGVYGFGHQPGINPGITHATQSGPTGAHHTPPEEGDTGHTAMPNGGYFAVLIPLLLAAALWSWRDGSWIPTAHDPLRFTTRTITPPPPHPSRGPTPYLFQVMRL